MKNSLVIFASIVLIFGVSKAVVAQDNNDSHEASHGVQIKVPSFALIDIEDGNGEATSISLEPTVSGLEAGEAVKFNTATNSQLWLNYTSVAEAGQKREISASISTGLPTGVSLKLVAGSISTGSGVLGVANDEITLTEGGESIVQNIGTCYTGSGSAGRTLTYTLDMDPTKYDELLAGDDYVVTVFFTISDQE